MYFNLFTELFCLQIANLMTDKRWSMEQQGNHCCTHIRGGQWKTFHKCRWRPETGEVWLIVSVITQRTKSQAPGELKAAWWWVDDKRGGMSQLIQADLLLRSARENEMSQLATCIIMIYINETTVDHHSAADIVMRGILLIKSRSGYNDQPLWLLTFLRNTLVLNASN